MNTLSDRLGPSSSPRVGVDVGGTFTDLAFVDTDGTLAVSKALGTPTQPATATLEALADLRRNRLLDGDALRWLRHAHGSTIAVNALIERRGSKLGLVTTRGFRDVLRLARLAVPEPIRFDSRRPEPLIPRSLTREVGGRLDVQGNELEPLNVEEVTEAARFFLSAGVERVVVSLIHSYREDAHERRVAEIFAAVAPGLPVDLSSACWPQAREFERTVLTAMNAYVGPAMNNYLDQLAAGTTAQGLNLEPAITRSNGGMQRAASIRGNPSAAFFSGPAAGVAAAALEAREAGMPAADLITVDVGGTSADVGVVRGGEPVLSTEEHVADFPVLMPSVAVSSVGAGGGSHIWVDELETLRVGPRSAGAQPGPVCYGLGGTIPTLTDAMTACGWMADNRVLGGRIVLSRDAAVTALVESSSRLGLTPIQLASGAIAIAVAVMAAETSRAMSRRGIDAPDFTLVPFGGAGPLLGALLAEEVYLRRVLVPRFPGALSAVGAALADVEGDLIVPVYRPLRKLDAETLRALARDLTRAAENWIQNESESLPIETFEFVLSAEMRYEGQGYDVPVPVENAWLANHELAAIEAAFHAAHNGAYGHSDTSGAVWLSELRVHVVGRVARPPLIPVKFGGNAVAAAKREIVLRGQSYEAVIYDRNTLGLTDHICGPAIVEQDDTTILIPDMWSAEVRTSGALLLTRENAP